MIISDSFTSLPTSVQTTVAAYAQAACLSPQAVIEFAVFHFLELDDQTQAAALQTQIEQYAAEVEMPIQVVIELAITHFLDPDAVTFDDCQLGVQQEQIEQLRQYQNVRQTAA